MKIFEYGLGEDYGADTDWYKELTNDAPFSQRHTVSIAGGTEVAQVYTSFMAQNQKGIVIGDNRKYLSALIVPVFAELEKWAKENGVESGSRADLCKDPKVNDLFTREIETYMKDYARVEQIRKFAILESEWSQETDELTPTLKLKRRVINQKYSDVIENMYPPDAS